MRGGARCLCLLPSDSPTPCCCPPPHPHTWLLAQARPKRAASVNNSICLVQPATIKYCVGEPGGVSKRCSNVAALPTSWQRLVTACAHAQATLLAGSGSGAITKDLLDACEHLLVPAALNLGKSGA